MPSPAPAAGKGVRTRQRIVDAAADLFHAHGINATSLGDVLRASGTGKGQFYQHFTSRDDLVLHVLRSHRAYLEGRDATPLTSWDDLYQWMLGHLDAQHAFDYVRGCPVGTAAYALQPDQNDERDELTAIFTGMRTRLGAFLTTEQTERRLDPDADPAALANFAVAAVQGGLLLSLLDRGPDAGRAAVDQAYRHLCSHRT